MMIRKSAGDPDGPEFRVVGGRVGRGRHVFLGMSRQGRIEMKWLQACKIVVVMIRVRSDLERFLVIWDDQTLYLWLAVHRGYIFIHVRCI
jgi:hypothetical protein